MVSAHIRISERQSVKECYTLTMREKESETEIEKEKP